MAEPTAPIVNKIFDLEKFMMFAPTPGVEGRRARLAWGLREGNPRLTVFTGDPKDTAGRNIINARMDPVTFYAFLNSLEEVARSPAESRCKLECMTGEYQDRQATGKKVLDSTLYYGKNAEGLVWLLIESAIPDRPKVRFIFEVYDYHAFYKTDGTAWTRGEASTHSAVATVNALRGIYSVLMAEALRELHLTRAAARGQANGGGASQQAKPAGNNAMFDDITF